MWSWPQNHMLIRGAKDSPLGVVTPVCVLVHIVELSLTRSNLLIMP